MLLHLPEGYKPEQVRDVLAAKIKTLPEVLRHSLTCDGAMRKSPRVLDHLPQVVLTVAVSCGVAGSPCRWVCWVWRRGVW
jgi:hypothetical protein